MGGKPPQPLFPGGIVCDHDCNKGNRFPWQNTPAAAATA